MTRRRRLITTILTASCWIFLLAFVLNSVFGASKQSKPIRSFEGKNEVRSPSTDP
jgi:uncharacterized BrkB/YihY/UPF0761 family membrane protein